MKSVERRKKIIEMVNEYKIIKTKDISKKLNENEYNIRRDVRILNDLGLIIKIHGGARVSSHVNFIKNYYFPEIENESCKKLIGRKAFELIDNNDSIFLGAGTTVVNLAEAILESDIKLNIITYSLPSATILAKKENVDLVFIGGKLIRNNYSFEGALVEEMLRYYTVDKAFLGVTGFSIDHGFTHSTIEQVLSTRAVAKVSDEIIFLADYHKFSRNKGIEVIIA
jgi:DeoR/GlpR family transcriptional regulator of sugar metabolism